jgi:hypothetical protein
MGVADEVDCISPAQVIRPRPLTATTSTAHDGKILVGSIPLT